MAAQRAAFPITGPRASSHEGAQTLQQAATELLKQVAADKARAGLTPAGADMSSGVAAVAKRERWNDGSLGGQHTPGQ